MSSVGATRAGMKDRCLVERDGAGVDAEGNPATPDWATHIASQPCRFWNGTSEREIVDGDKVVVVEALMAQLPLGADVTESDRINGIVDRRGATLHDGVLDIRAVIGRRTHLELVLQGAAA